MDEDPTVKLARHRFKNVLYQMSTQDSWLEDGDSDSDLEDGRSGRASLGYPLPRKRSKMDAAADAAKPQTSFVMKLFDRGLDLGQFDDNTPLYPICRSWMQNKPHNPKKRSEDEKDEEEAEIGIGIQAAAADKDSDEVTQLPPPEPLPRDQNGNPISVRIPAPLPRENEPFVINPDDDMAPSPALLFQNHLDRWKNVRERWREACENDERRYEVSFNVLRQLHNNT